MKAIIYTRYGSPDVLQFRDVPAPKPADDEVLVKVHAASVNPLDFHQMRGDVRLMTGLRGPKDNVLGCDIAGSVEAVGAQVTQLRPGDDVFGIRGLAGGGFAEYACAKENRLARKPAGISFEDAAAVPVAAVTALQGLRDKGRIRAGQRVLIDGASGGVGTFAVQIAKSFGAEVTAVCSTSKLDVAKASGADYVIDYTRENFTRSGPRYDLIFGANAYHSIFEYRRALARNGRYVMAGGGAGIRGVLAAALVGPFVSMTGHRKVCFFIAKINNKDLQFLGDLLQSGKIRPVIDRRYPLSEAADAVRYLEEGHARGKVVLTVASDSEDLLAAAADGAS